MDKFTAFIEKLQKKPTGQKRLIVLGSSLFITGLILIVWVSTSPLFPSTHQEAVIPNKTASPFAAFGANVSLVVSSIKDIWNGKDTGPQFNPVVTPGPSSGGYGAATQSSSGMQATSSAPAAQPSVGIPQIPSNNY